MRLRSPSPSHLSWSFFFFNDTATTEIYTLSLHDALPICRGARVEQAGRHVVERGHPVEQAELLEDESDVARPQGRQRPDRKSTRLNSSHANISYAVFCLKKKKQLASHKQYGVYPTSEHHT